MPPTKTSNVCWLPSSLVIKFNLFLLIIIIQQVPNVLTQRDGSLQPIFIKNMDRLAVKENTPIGELIYTLEAQIDGRIQQTRIWYSIEGTQLFSVDKYTGQVRVAQQIDREQISDTITCKITATTVFDTSMPGQAPKYQPGPFTQLAITIFIIDENDNVPKIDYVKVGSKDYDESYFNMRGSSMRQTSPIIRLNISETTLVGSAIVDLIRASDVDKVSQEPLMATCIDCEPDFELTLNSSDGSLNDQLTASIILSKNLIHIPRNNVRRLQVDISDGKFNTTIYFEVTIEDVQNKPPQFVGSNTCVVQENAPIDKVITTVRAVDGDVVPFDELPTLSSLSKDSLLDLEGRQIIYDLLNPNTGQYGSSTNEFKLNPLTGQVQVANRLDREMHLSLNGILTFRVRARELRVTTDENLFRAEGTYDSILDQLTPLIDQSAVAETDITVILVDMNDNSPHWLNASEVSLMNSNKSPGWYNNLPNDHDTNRIYHVHVKENSPIGTPITKNEIFVYDLDNGLNANFNLTIEDPFNMFDVEPKQISGFAMISLKLVGNRRRVQQQTRLLDYENPNEKSFIIQLIATETSTNERLTSKAHVRVDVLDVNDNAPEFRDAAYFANIREDAQPGKSVILMQATDKDEVSQNIVYSLHGKSSQFFDINAQSGLITVAKCDLISPSASSNRMRQLSVKQPASKSCIDYETQRSHYLMVEASDGELSRKVPLTIFIDDVSDNPPVFALPVVDVVIEEGAESLSLPIRVEATDLDKTSMISYSIIEGNFEGLFNINKQTGELQLTRPIRVANEDGLSKPDIIGESGQQQLNKIILVIQASDGVFNSNCTVRIDVLDANDNAPKFLRDQYQAEIDESVSPGYPVITVRAIDSDRGHNARVSYRIERGSFNQFEIHESKGLVTVAQNADSFNARKRENYTLEVIAYDHGLNPKSSSTLVHIRVLDNLKTPPRFEPQTQKIDIPENTLNNTIVHQMLVENPEEIELQMLVFEPGPIQALDRNGQLVSSGESERLESMFGVSKNTGEVVVNSALDHDFAAFVNLTIYVSRRQDLAMGPKGPMIAEAGEPPIREYSPKSVGYLIINVVDVNHNPPIFGAPWSPSQPDLSFQMLEELPVGSILTQLIATDADSKISHYKIDPPNDYFELVSPQSGLIVNKKQIDYDALMSQTYLRPGSHRTSTHKSNVGNNIIQFNLYAFDFGMPQLSAKATVSVEILPINDNDCKFEQQVYESNIKENALMDTLVVQVRAHDLDIGEQHNEIRYQLQGDNSDLFNIDQRTGLITVSKKGSAYLDRERLNRSSIVLTALGRDGDQAFQVDSQSFGPLRSNRGGRLNADGSSRTCLTTVKVNILDVNDNPPLFLQRSYEVIAYDNDSKEVPLLKLLIRDDDSSSNSILQPTTKQPTNTFKIISGNRDNIFNITDSGLLYTTKTLGDLSDENNSTYQLKIQVRQSSLTSFTDECLVTVHYVKINRFGPEWPKTLESTKQQISVEENSKPGTFVTQLKCTDQDYEYSRDLRFSKISPQDSQMQIMSPMRYWFRENGTNVDETNEFKLDPITGKITTKSELDRETKPFHHLVVVCEDNGKPQSLSSMTSIYIYVRDVDDNKPEFKVSPSQNPRGNFRRLNENRAETSYPKSRDNHRLVITFYVEEQQSRGLQVGELQAIDPDIVRAHPITYCIIEGNEFREFYLDTDKGERGILYTNQTLDREKQSSYELTIKAINDGLSCADHSSNGYANQMTRSSNMTDFKTRSKSNEDREQLDVITVKIEVTDINDNPPTYKRPIHRAGVRYRSLMNTFITQVAVFDPDSGSNGTSTYKISEILLYKTSSDDIPNQHHQQSTLSKPIRLIESPFKIDQHGDIYTQQLLTQYQLMSMFLVNIEAREQAEPFRVARTKLEIYLYETSSQLNMHINLHPRQVEPYRYDIEQLLSNATNYTAIISQKKNHWGGNRGLSIEELNDIEQMKSRKYTPSVENGLLEISLPSSSSPSSTTMIQVIFVDNYNVINPNLVMERFDSQHLAMHNAQALGSLATDGTEQQQARQLKLSSLIDKIALASVQASDSSSNKSSGQHYSLGIDWLENPSVIYVVLTAALFFGGFVIFILGCCCGSRIKDHIIKTAMNKLVQQQNMQAKINEQMLAAAANGTLNNANERTAMSEHDFVNSQAGLMSSFDATKGCISNNQDNMILQRAMESGEFIDPNYNTLNGHYNFGAHYYDTSELDQQQANGQSNFQKKQVDESNISVSMVDENEANGDTVDQANGQRLLKNSRLANGDKRTDVSQRQRQQFTK